MSRASKKSKVVTPETSPNFLSLPLQAFSLEALLTLQEEVPKQIQKYLALQEKEKQAPPPPVPASEFIDIHDVDRVRLANDDLYMMELWRQRHAQFPQGHIFSKPAPNKRACSANLLGKYPELRFSEKENKVYCLTCVIANGIPGDEDVSLVTEGFDDFKNLQRRADSHFNAEERAFYVALVLLQSI